MSWLSQILKAKGLPEVDLLKNPKTAPFLRPLVDGLTTDNLRKALPLLDNDSLHILAVEVANELERREA